MVLSELEEIIDVSVPGLNIDGKGTLSFATTLVYVSCCVVENLEHRDKPVRIAIRSSYIGVGSTHI